MVQDFKAQLAEQLRSLALSCESFDAGFQDEAVRIATSVRVLLHDTKRQTSLLSHLNARKIQLATTVETLDASRSAVLSGIGVFTFSNTGLIASSAAFEVHQGHSARECLVGANGLHSRDRSPDAPLLDPRRSRQAGRRACGSQSFSGVRIPDD